jgi:hypothetical protein
LRSTATSLPTPTVRILEDASTVSLSPPLIVHSPFIPSLLCIAECRTFDT